MGFFFVCNRGNESGGGGNWTNYVDLGELEQSAFHQEDAVDLSTSMLSFSVFFVFCLFKNVNVYAFLSNHLWLVMKWDFGD